MVRSLIAILLTSLLLSVVAVPAAIAGIENGGGNGNSGNNGNGNGNSGGNGSGNGNGAGGAPALSDIAPVPDEQQAVQDAVRNKQALPLEAITELVTAAGSGRILDIQLITARAVLLYDVTIIETDGFVHHLYYEARSGSSVDLN